MKNFEQESKEFFESLSREEFINLLSEVGYELTEGTGEVIYEEVNSFSIPGKVEEKGYKTNTSYSTCINSFPIAC